MCVLTVVQYKAKGLPSKTSGITLFRRSDPTIPQTTFNRQYGTDPSSEVHQETLARYISYVCMEKRDRDIHSGALLTKRTAPWYVCRSP
ncbi:hypothetical protein JTE90_019560 [Oedothorax gibbosus]|uniref:Uncharacterized protein n=1 Tax=Oedothorax gibbosus TaxID=931172 RepID=A0AAV6V5C5_9ARAC|nr:hypothetical protein JTE90_019560 [Oedothorax gibbosus]